MTDVTIDPTSSQEREDSSRNSSIREEVIEIDPVSGGEDDGRDELPTSPAEDFDDSDHFNPNERIKPKARADSDKYRFIRDFYRYYNEKGFTCVVMKEISNLLIPHAINLMTFIILNHINLVGMLSCKGEECATIPIIINLGLMYDYSWTNYFAILFNIGVLVYIGYLTYRAWTYISRMWSLKKIVNVDLGVDEDTLKTITWGEFVEILIQKNKEIEIFREDDIDALDVVNYIMRFDNFIISLEHLSLLDLRLPLLSEPILPEVVVYNIRWALRDLFNNQNLQTPVQMPTAADYLKNRFIFYGIINLVLSPFIFLYILIKVFFTYFAEFHANKTFFFNRKWSTLSLWKFRSYNELPHEFKNRISKSEMYANMYVNQFPSPMFSIIGNNLMFFSSAFCAIILALTTFKNPLLIHMSFMGQNLLWWSVILLAVFAGASGLVIGQFDVFRPQKYMNKVGKYTHFLPEEWKVNARDPKVLKDFQGKYFQVKLKWFLIELLSIFITPYFLIFKFPESSRIIVEFIRAVQEKPGSGGKVTRFMQGGPVCGFATFQFSDFSHFEVVVKENVGSQVRRHEVRMKNDGKLEKSYLLFKANHPKWKERNEIGKQASMLIGSLLEMRDRRKQKKIEDVLRQSQALNKKSDYEDLIKYGHRKDSSSDHHDREDIFEDENEQLKEKLKKTLKKNINTKESQSEIAFGMLNTFIKQSGNDLKKSMDGFRDTTTKKNVVDQKKRKKKKKRKQQHQLIDDDDDEEEEKETIVGGLKKDMKAVDSDDDEGLNISMLGSQDFDALGESKEKKKNISKKDEI